MGVPDSKSTWDKRGCSLDHIYKFKNGIGLKVLRTFIDSGGHYTKSVYDYCRKNIYKQRFAIKGVGSPGMPLYDRNNTKWTLGNSLPLVRLGVDDGKEMVLARLSIEEVGAKYFHFPLDEKEAKETDKRGYNDLYFKGIVSEHKKLVRRNGVLHEIWETTKSVRNEPLDLRVYNLACMQSLSHDWDAYEKALQHGAEIRPTAKKKAAVKKQNVPVKRRVNIW